jgi:hypothetical protein
VHDLEKRGLSTNQLRTEGESLGRA